MLLLFYLTVMTIYAFVLFGIDKRRATKDTKHRIPERKLIAFTVLGGAIGSGLGMVIFWHKVNKKKFYITVPVFVILTLLVTGACFYMNLHLTVSEYEYVSEEIPPKLDGCRIVQVSDLHNQFYGFHEQALTNRIAELKPDIIVVTGDVVDCHFTNYKLALRFFEGAVKIAPVYYVTGNHEGRLSGKRYEDFKRQMDELGVHRIDNTKVELEGLTIIGIGDDDLAVPPRELQTDEGFCICLAHEPMYYNRYLALGADIAFVGHMHGGQIIIPGKGGFISPDFTFFPELYAGAHDYTLKTGQAMTMYISRGLGNSVLPLRINNYPELVAVTLRSAAAR
ncbi:MAG: DUF1294 domain-containing protein [Lachnospiraceae bacterium]|nr:DUF1294 domain-containing protein [Lachnospiraceae bacterium]